MRIEITPQLSNGGGGSANEIAYWSNATTLTGDSLITVSGANDQIGVGAALPGSISAPGFYAGGSSPKLGLQDGANQLWLIEVASNTLKFTRSGVGTDISCLNGNLGIGNSSPGSKLTIGANSDCTIDSNGNIAITGQGNRTISQNRNTTSNTAGNNLTVSSGGATSGATSKVGGNLILQPGIGTSAGVPSVVTVQAPAQGTGGTTTDQTLVNRIIINGTKALTSGVAVTIATCTIASGSMSGGHIVYTIEATDGVDYIACSGQVAFAAVNKATVFTTTTSILGTEAIAKSNVVDTIANTWAFAAASGNLQVTSTLGTLVATTFRITYEIISNSQQAITN